MRYKSNLSAPDLRPHFKLRNPPLQLAGHDAPSDPDFLPDCSYWTDDEAAILYNVAASVPPGRWVDIGARLGWTAAHVAEAGHQVWLVDPEHLQEDFFERLRQNTRRWTSQWMGGTADTSTRFFESLDSGEKWTSYFPSQFDGFIIDGCHDSPEPLNDARGALAHAKPDCIIMLHDFQGPAVRDGVRYLMDNGWHCRVYWTPNQVACCWRGHKAEPLAGNPLRWKDWMPPDHTPDPAIDWRPHKAAMVDFSDYWSRCE